MDIEKTVKFNDERLSKRVDDFRKELMVTLVDKHEQVEQKVQVLRDTVEIIASHGDSSSKHGGGLGAEWTLLVSGRWGWPCPMYYMIYFYVPI